MFLSTAFSWYGPDEGEYTFPAVIQQLASQVGG